MELKSSGYNPMDYIIRTRSFAQPLT